MATINIKLPVLLIVLAVFLLTVGCAVSPNDPNQDQTIKVLGMTLVYDDGSWVNPNETKFELNKPGTWLKRNYGRHYMQGSDEIVSSLIEFDWLKIKESLKAGKRVKLGEVVRVFRFKKTYVAIKTHPEAAIVPFGMAIGSALEGSEGVVVYTIGLTETAITTSFKVLKLIGQITYQPIKPIIGGQ